MYINTHYEQDRQFTITGGEKIRRILNLPIIEIAPTICRSKFIKTGLIKIKCNRHELQKRKDTSAAGETFGGSREGHERGGPG
jgi:hypothetical protein